MPDGIFGVISKHATFTAHSCSEVFVSVRTWHEATMLFQTVVRVACCMTDSVFTGLVTSHVENVEGPQRRQSVWL
jgi:hypothetical protein